MTRPDTKVLDSWAMVAWVCDESGATAVHALLELGEAGRVRLLMSVLNVGETFYTLAKRRNLGIAEQFLRYLAFLPVEVCVPDRAGVMAAARIKAVKAVAYGDSFAIALAQAEDASVVTGDDEIRQCGLVPVDWVGR